MDESNLGSTLERGTAYCLIGDPHELSATLVVDETEIERIQVGQRAWVWLREHPGRALAGSVQKVSTKEMERAPDSLINKDDVKMIDDGEGQSRLASTSFRVRVTLEDAGIDVPLRSTVMGQGHRRGNHHRDANQRIPASNLPLIAGFLSSPPGILLVLGLD